MFLFGLFCFKNFINYLDERIHIVLIRFSDDAKLHGIVNTVEDRNRMQLDLDKMEDWA